MTLPSVTSPRYPAYDALWHLVAMGVLTNAHEPLGWAPPEGTVRPTRVAMIDTSIAFDHPNLRDSINRTLALDLFSARLGSFSGMGPDVTLGALGLGDSRDVAHGLPHTEALLNDLTARLSPGQGSRYQGIAPATSAVFSAHGTAMAGLIGARPTVIAADPTDLPTSDGTIALPYCGVDPMCEIVPISTNFDADPEALILAFLYADLIRADVVLLPRVIPDPLRTVPELSPYVLDDLGDQTLAELTSAVPVPGDAKEQWDELLEVIVRVSMRRAVVCAAGNANEEYGVYPANFASDENGIIAVGAVNAKGWNCSYSPKRNLTIWAPSTDAERWDRAEVRLDARGAGYDPEVVPAVNANHRYSAFDIISTDVPGNGGYAVSPFAGISPHVGADMREYGSYFCRFGGTSAASAQIAGLLALGHSLGRLAHGCGGVDAKTWLMSNAVPVGPEDGSMLAATLNGTAHFPDA